MEVDAAVYNSYCEDIGAGINVQVFYVWVSFVGINVPSCASSPQLLCSAKLGSLGTATNMADMASMPELLHFHTFYVYLV